MYKWLIPDMFWPEGPDTQSYVSHEAICVLNDTARDAEIDITLYFEDASPVYLPRIICPANRTRHLRMDKLAEHTEGRLVRGIPYAAKLECAVKIAVQYSRLDTNSNCTLMSTSINQAQ